MARMYQLFWNLRQGRLSDAVREGREAKRTADTAATRVDELQAQVESLRLMCAAMGSLMQERCGITDEEFRTRVSEIDMRDGRVDGRMPPQAAKCPKCGRQMSTRHPHCLYCGAEGLQIGPSESEA